MSTWTVRATSDGYQRVCEFTTEKLARLRYVSEMEAGYGREHETRVRLERDGEPVWSGTVEARRAKGGA